MKASKPSYEELDDMLGTALRDLGQAKRWTDEAVLLADTNFQRYDTERERAERAEATLAAIRAYLNPDRWTVNSEQAQDLRALLDAAPKETK